VTARQLILELLARDKTGPATSSAAHNLEDVGDAAEGAAKHTEKLGKEAGRADEKVERYGKSSRTAAEHVQHLDREIKLCERELEKLAVAFAEAETAGDRADLSKGIRQTRSELDKLKKNRNVLEDLIPDAGEAKQFEKTFSNTISNAIENAKVGPVLAVGIAAAAPLIGATISAAVIGAAGVGNFTGTAIGTRLKMSKPELLIIVSVCTAAASCALVALLFDITVAVFGMLICAITNALSKIALDALIQRDVVETQRSSAFARSETFLQLAWVLGAAFGVLLPVSHGGGVGFMVAGAVVSTVAVVVVLRYRVLTGRAAVTPRAAGSVSDRDQRPY